jgi:predicted O-methyltransferase YrrM
MITLPECRNVEDGWIRGRVPREGYQRGWGLQHGGLSDAIDVDPLFQAASAASEGLSIVDHQRRKNIFLIITQFLGRLASQDIIEFGAYKGGNALFMAYLLQEMYPKACVYALDTFEGMPDVSGVDLHAKGDFRDNSPQIIEDAMKRQRLGNIRIVQGLFEDTFPSIAQNRPAFALAHIDCDIYSAVKYSQDAVRPFMTPGGYIIYDDANTSSCIGAIQAVEEMIRERDAASEQIWPHWVFRT